MSMIVRDIDLDLIDIPNGRRKLDPSWISTLADLIEADGQITPIEVIAAANGRFRLISGAHRVAARRMKLSQTIFAVVRPADAFASEAQLKLREIAENFARRELSVLDRAMDVAAWREIFEAAKGTVKPGRKRKDDNRLQSETINLEEAGEAFAATFKEAACHAFKLSGPVIYRLLQIAGLSEKVRDQISLHPIADNRSELVALATSPAEWHGQIAHMIVSGTAANVAAAIAVIENRQPAAPIAKWARLSDGFSRLKPTEQDRFFDLHADAIERWLASRKG